MPLLEKFVHFHKTLFFNTENERGILFSNLYLEQDIIGLFIIKTYSKNFINNFVIYRNYNIKIIDDYNFIRS